MLSAAKSNIKSMPYSKKVVLLLLLLAVIAAGVFLGAFLNYRENNRTYRATFVVNKPVLIHSAA